MACWRVWWKVWHMIYPINTCYDKSFLVTHKYMHYRYSVSNVPLFIHQKSECFPKKWQKDPTPIHLNSIKLFVMFQWRLFTTFNRETAEPIKQPVHRKQLLHWSRFQYALFSWVATTVEWMIYSVIASIVSKTTQNCHKTKPNRIKSFATDNYLRKRMCMKHQFDISMPTIQIGSALNVVPVEFSNNACISLRPI